MFDYESLVKACERFGLDPFKKENKNIYLKSKLMSTFSEPFNLGYFGLTPGAIDELKKIGEIMRNLYSQQKSHGTFNLCTENGKKEYKITKKIDEIIPFFEKSMHYWLNKCIQLNIQKRKDDKQFVIYYGLVYEVNPEYQKNINKMNEKMEKVHRESIQKQNASMRAARNVILD